jgi:hypothetical protein
VLEVVDEADGGPVLEQCRYGFVLIVADFEGEEALGLEGRVGRGNEAAVDF